MSDKSRTRRGELEYNQRQLPADKKVRGASNAAKAKARTDAANTPIGQPPIPVDVRSVYDTRPINAFDFNIVDSVGADSTTANPTVFFQVPEGFVCVLRNFDIWFEDNPVGVRKSDFTWSLQLNGGDYPYNINVPFGVAVDRETVFLIANEFNTVGLRVNTSDPATAFVPSVTLYARFYGNFLLKSGLPPSLEIGNAVPKSAIPPKAPPPKRSTVPPTSPIAQPVPSPMIVSSAPPSPVIQKSTPRWTVGVARFASAAGSKGGGPKARLVINENGKQRLPSAQELRDYAYLFDAARATMPSNTQWI